MKADFSKIIKESVRITKSNKRLWVLGLVLASFSFGGNFNFGGSFNNLNKLFDENNQKNIHSIDGTPYRSPYKRPNNMINSNLLGSASQLPQVLGTTSSSAINLLKLIPPQFFIAFGLAMTIIFILGLAVSLYAQSWAQAGLISGVNMELNNENPSLYQMSDKGKAKALQLIKLKIFPTLALGLIATLVLIIISIPIAALGPTAKALSPLLTLPYVLLVIVAAIAVFASIQLGSVVIVLNSADWKEAFGKGFAVFRKFFFDVLVMGLINCLAGCALGIVTLAVVVLLLGVGGAALFGGISVPPFLIVAAPLLVLAILALIFITTLANAIFTVFKQSTWVLLYKQLTEEDHGSK